MPIEIIPKAPEKESVSVNVLFYISIGLLVSVILSYFLLDYFQKNTDDTLKDIDITLRASRTPEEQELERNILQYQRKINDFSLVFNRHQTNSNFFPFLEEITHPQVRFSTLSLTESSAQIAGEAKNLMVLNQQLLIFQKNPKIFNTNLSQILFEEDGKINFNFTFTLSPEIFEFK